MADEDETVDPVRTILGGPGPRVAAVVVAYGAEPWLERCVRALLDSQGVQVEVVLVDNGGTEGAVDRLGALDRVTAVYPGSNTGFAAGCNLGVAASHSPVVALVNPDTLVEADALAELAAVALRPEVGIATGAIVFGDDAEKLTSAGNDVHFLGMSWGGRFGAATKDHQDEVPVMGASGAGMACRRDVWDALGGFDDEFFAYFEDADLSLRCWQRGLQVVYVPSAIVAHRYEFARNDLKFRLLERNRLIVVGTVFGRRQLLLTLPLLLVFELLMIAYAASTGWLPQKVAGYRWLWQHRAWLRARRVRVQGERRVGDRPLARLFADRMDPGNMPLPDAVAPLDRLLAGYWHLVRRVL